ncbi:MAG: hypothetical protein RM368_02890 [Nostoc sp. DedSLP03]|uniref:hypothetical protein n=1 Tax=Nostoc sp. DedSLP03 TaxID=3075400 RepID=UPI002AD459A7|nr:hypothetical protein [Nostoc sp. DedSLP03]MDZ7963910.1 hypothetical protein [Nostoc sp. DedSLP03]
MSYDKLLCIYSQSRELIKRYYRYLFSVDAFEALFSTALDNPKSFLAVAIETTELFQITTADLAAQIAVKKANATQSAENYLDG